MKRPEVVRGYITPWMEWADWLEAERDKDREAMRTTLENFILNPEFAFLTLQKRLEE